MCNNTRLKLCTLTIILFTVNQPVLQRTSCIKKLFKRLFAVAFSFIWNWSVFLVRTLWHWLNLINESIEIVTVYSYVRSLIAKHGSVWSGRNVFARHKTAIQFIVDSRKFISRECVCWLIIIMLLLKLPPGRQAARKLRIKRLVIPPSMYKHL